MARDKTRDLRRMNRRSFVKTLSAMGASATTLSYLSQDALAQVTHDPKEEVPYVAYLKGEPPEREPVYKTIERDEWERRHTAIDVGENVHEMVSEISSTNLIEVGYQADEDSPTDFGVLVTYKKRASETEVRTPEVALEELKEGIPDKMRGEAGAGEYRATREDIPIRVEEVETELTDCIPNDYRQYTAGGMPHQVVPNNGTPRDGTLCAPYFSYTSDSSGLILSGHVAENGGGLLAEVTQEATKTVGYVNYIYNDNIIDFAFTSRSDIVKQIIDENNDQTDYVIYGIVTNDEIANNTGNSSYRVKTQGRKTCRDEGYITWLDTNPKTTGNVRTSTSVDGGDSGGPLFHFDEQNGIDKAWIAGVIRESYIFPDDTGSTTAETVEDKYSGYWHAL